MDTEPRCLICNPLRLPRCGSNLAIQCHSCFQYNERQLLHHPFQEHLIELHRLCLADACHDLNASILQNPDAFPCNQRIRVLHCHNNFFDARLSHSLGTGACTPIVRTRLQCNIKRCSPGKFTSHTQSMDLRMRRASFAVPAIPYDTAIFDNDRPNQRVRRCAPRSLPRKMQCLLHIIFILQQINHLGI